MPISPSPHYPRLFAEYTRRDGTVLMAVPPTRPYSCDGCYRRHGHRHTCSPESLEEPLPHCYDESSSHYCIFVVSESTPRKCGRRWPKFLPD